MQFSCNGHTQMWRRRTAVMAAFFRVEEAGVEAPELVRDFGVLAVDTEAGVTGAGVAGVVGAAEGPCGVFGGESGCVAGVKGGGRAMSMCGGGGGGGGGGGAG